jgi:hypothetical protein
MHRNFARLICLGFTICLIVPRAAFADDYTGKYQGPNLSMQIDGSPDSFTGVITLGNQQFPIKAHLQGTALAGTFTSQGNDFPFSAELSGNQLSLTTAGTTYTLTRQSSPANPLAPAAADAGNPLIAANTGDAPSGYLVIASKDAGRTLFIQKPNCQNVQTALQSTIGDLTKYFDAKPLVTGAFADAQGSHNGGAFFTAVLKGQNLKGWIICGLQNGTAAVTVIYDRPDAPRDEVSALLAAMPGQSKLSEHDFPDGSGSVNLPDNWQTNSTSVVGGVSIQGPSGQIVTLGQGTEVLTPDNMLVRNHNQMVMNAQQWGQPPPPPMQMLVAPYCEPTDAMTTLMPQLSALSQSRGGPAVRLDQIIQSTDVQAGFPNGKAALIYYRITRTVDGQDISYRGVARIETYVIGQGAWGVYSTSLLAPDKTFDTDLPTMMAISQSFKCNDQVVAQITQDSIRQNNQRFASFEHAQQEKSQAFDQFMQQTQNDQLVRQRSNDNFDEMIRGYRTVVDTDTGEKQSVDLGNSDQIVESMNKDSPGKYVAVPLRDEADPIPAGQ